MKFRLGMLGVLVMCGGLLAGPLEEDREPVKNPVTEEARKAALKKIRLKLDNIDASGLRGPADGKVAVDYEFCIPHDAKLMAEVKKIDPSVKMRPGGRGRIQCDPNLEVLCIGNTHQKGWKTKLLKLAALDYVKEIRQCVWE